MKRRQKQAVKLISVQHDHVMNTNSIGWLGVFNKQTQFRVKLDLNHALIWHEFTNQP